MKDKIKSFLAEAQVKYIAIKYANDQYGKLRELMAKDGLSFAKAAARLGLKPEESAFLSRNEYIEGLGEADKVVDEGSKLKPGEVSKVIETGNGAVIFIVSDTQKFDKEKFNKEIDDYSKKVLEMKKSYYLENWLKGLERANTINIDFKDYEKYYR